MKLLKSIIMGGDHACQILGSTIMNPGNKVRMIGGESWWERREGKGRRSTEKMKFWKSKNNYRYYSSDLLFVFSFVCFMLFVAVRVVDFPK